MPTPGEKSASPPERARRGVNWRLLLRSFHRDLGYLSVGLTFVYAVSGLAVNHIADWDPNFKSYRRAHALSGPLPRQDAEAARAVLDRLAIRESPRQVYRAAPDRLDIMLDGRTLHVDPVRGQVIEEGRKPRFLVRVANWLHLNRGKKAWTIVADLYAVGLLALAGTGMFMLAGRKGLLGRGGVLVALGVAIPVLYVALSGGPR